MILTCCFHGDEVTSFGDFFFCNLWLNNKDPVMLLLRYQRQRAQEIEGGEHRAEDFDMRRKLNDRDVKGESHRAATRGTLICIFVCGSLLLSLGLTLLLAGLLIPKLKKDPTPWLVTGPTCIVLGILVLLLSVEIILKLRKISSTSDSCDQSDSQPAPAKAGWGGTSHESEDALKEDDVERTIPVIIQGTTPFRQLDPSTLPQTVPDRR